MNDQEKNLAAAYMARSNMGQPKAPLRFRTSAFGPHGYGSSLASAVNGICREFMETDEHETLFMDEAAGWLDRINEDGEEKFFSDFSHVAAWINYRPKRWKDAAAILEGAINPIAIANALSKACKEASDEGEDSHHDPACRMIVYQLAHLMRANEVDDPVRYNRMMKRITDMDAATRPAPATQVLTA